MLFFIGLFIGAGATALGFCGNPFSRVGAKDVKEIDRLQEGIKQELQDAAARREADIIGEALEDALWRHHLRVMASQRGAILSRS